MQLVQLLALSKHTVTVKTRLWARDLFLDMTPRMPTSNASLTACFCCYQWRIVFDEGHTLKNKTTVQAKAAYGLVSDQRWVVTGTPVDREIEEFHGLLLALQVCCRTVQGYCTWLSPPTVLILPSCFASAALTSCIWADSLLPMCPGVAVH